MTHICKGSFQLAKLLLQGNMIVASFCAEPIGMSIAANKVPGVYAALGTNTYSAERAIKQ